MFAMQGFSNLAGGITIIIFACSRESLKRRTTKMIRQNPPSRRPTSCGASSSCLAPPLLLLLACLAANAAWRCCRNVDRILKRQKIPEI
ncbi:hypothetical protein KSP39_PZI003497 [Platanthera zijinensis]|uniref:Uncharacterized protein n=1 Tax=Platanthera zijinensis TaxID=2320716 RepID=A0AAP0GCJ9_9ASPA